MIVFLMPHYWHRSRGQIWHFELAGSRGHIWHFELPKSRGQIWHFELPRSRGHIWHLELPRSGGQICHFELPNEYIKWKQVSSVRLDGSTVFGIDATRRRDFHWQAGPSQRHSEVFTVEVFAVPTFDFLTVKTFHGQPRLPQARSACHFIHGCHRMR